MRYKVTARRYGNSVEFDIEAPFLKEALSKAIEEAREIFSYDGIGDDPTVSIKISKDQD